MDRRVEYFRFLFLVGLLLAGMIQFARRLGRLIWPECP